MVVKQFQILNSINSICLADRKIEKLEIKKFQGLDFETKCFVSFTYANRILKKFFLDI